MKTTGLPAGKRTGSPYSSREEGKEGWQVQREEQLYGFSCLQQEGVAKFGTDSLLLWDFCPTVRGDVADLGCGCGVLGLLMSEKCTGRIRAVDICPQAVALARENFARNGLSARAEAVQGDLRERACLPPAGSVALCVSNPPYFAPGAGAESPDPARRLARSGQACSVADVCEAARRCLCFRGRLCLCWRPERMGELFAALAAAGLEPKRLRTVHARQDRPAGLLLCEARLGAAPGMTAEPPLILAEADGSPTAEYRRIYRL